ncbi:MAG: ABC transporter permease [Candidatus Acidiferrales bacterium]
MKGRDLAELAARNLREAVLRNSLTTLGIAVGVASLVAMLSLGVGLQNLASDRLSRTGLFDAIFVTPKPTTPSLRRMENPIPARPEPVRPLDDDGRHQLEALPDVIAVYPEIRFPTEIHFAGNPYATVVAGVAPSDRNDGAFDQMKGSFFSGPAADEAIVQIELARQLSTPPEAAIGKDVVLRYAERQALPADSGGTKSDGYSIVPREEKLRIVGIIETDPAGGFGAFGRARLFIPLKVAETLRAAQTNDLRDLLRDTPSKRTYDSLTVRVSGASKVKAAEDAIKQMGFAAYSLLDASNSLNLVFRVFDMFLAIFGSLALVVASLGIVNTLVMAILERRREIGILKALGAADRDVKTLFFVEAGAMGLVGGVLGVLIGWLIGRAINFGTNVYLARQALPAISVTAVPWWMVGLAITFSILVSLVAGMYPASRAARLDPVQALRYE